MYLSHISMNTKPLLFIASAFAALAIATVACGSALEPEPPASSTLERQATERLSDLRSTGVGSYDERSNVIP